MKDRLKESLSFFLFLVISVCFLGCTATDRYLRKAAPDIRQTYYELEPVMTDSETVEFLKLSRVEREKWIAKFWKSKDPTPTTERNEFKEEHEKRVEYAKANFGSGFTMRPWDDRGEVYIKYGEPDEKEPGIYASSTGRQKVGETTGLFGDIHLLSTGDAGEIWHYWQYSLDLQFEDRLDVGYYGLTPYISQIEANRSKPLPHEQSDRIQNFMATKAEKVEMQKEIYKHDYGGEPLDYALDVVSFRFKKDLYDVDVNLGIPTDKLGGEDDTVAQGSLMRRISVFDANLSEVAKDSTTQYFSAPSQKGLLLVDQKTFKLAPGEYTIAAEVKDLATNRIGIYKKEILLPAHTDPKEQYISQIIMASEIRAPQPNERKYVKYDLAVVPLPSKTYYADQMIKFYYEVYNLKLDQEGKTRYLVTYDLVNAKQKKERNIYNSYVLTAKSSDIYEVGYIDPAEVSAGDYILVARVQDALSGKIMKSVSPFCILDKKKGEKKK